MTDTVIFVPLQGFKADLKTKTDNIIHVPLATRNTHGVVKIGDGLNIDADGVLSFDRSEVTILKITNSNEIDPATGEKYLKVFVPDKDKVVDLGLTKYSVGLNFVDNTADMDKPVSNPQQKALDKKQNIHVGVDKYNKLLWVNQSGDIDFIQTFGTIQALNNDVPVSNDVQIFNFGPDFKLSVKPNEEGDTKEILIDASPELKAVLKNVTYAADTGILTFTKYDGSTFEIDLPLELLVQSGYYDKVEKDIVLVLANGQEIRVSVEDILALYYADEQTITLTVTDDGLNIFSVKDGGIDSSKLSKSVNDLINSKASQTDLNAVVKKNTDQDDRLTKLESSDSSQNTRLSNLETASAEQSGKISDLESANKTHDNRLDVLEANDEVQDQSLTALESTTATHTTQIQQLQTDNAAQDERQNTLETAIATEKTNRETEDAAIRKEIQTIQAGETELNEQILNRLETLETTKASTEYVDNKNSEQDTRLTNIETKNSEQDASISELTGDLADTNSNLYDLSGEVTAIKEKIPTQASKTNQLADKMFVNSSIQTATANFRGNWDNWEAVPAVDTAYPADYAGGKRPTVNDYLVVQDASDYRVTPESPEPAGLEGTWRFKFTGTWASDGKDGWLPEYQVNEKPFTAKQLAAIDSGITEELTAQITTNKNDIATNKNDIAIIKSKNETQDTAITKAQTTADSAVSKNTEQDTAILKAQTTADNAMPKSGGQFTGRVSWNATSLPAMASPQYFVTIEPFADGGRTYYTSLANTKQTLGVTSNETAIRALETMLGETQKQVALKYEKPSGGIPKTDLVSAVQTSLSKADNSIQNITGDSNIQVTIKSDRTVSLSFNPVILGSLTFQDILTNSNPEYFITTQHFDSTKQDILSRTTLTEMKKVLGVTANEGEIRALNTQLGITDGRVNNLENNKVSKSGDTITGTLLIKQTSDLKSPLTLVSDVNDNNYITLGYNAFSQWVGGKENTIFWSQIATKDDLDNYYNNRIACSSSNVKYLMSDHTGTGTVQLSDAITNYDFLIVRSDNNEGRVNMINVYPSIFVSYLWGYNKEIGHHGFDNISFRYKFTDATHVQITAEYYARKVSIIGYKIFPRNKTS